MASPRPPPPSLSLFDLEITVISAKHLKNVNWRKGDLKPYAVAYLHPDRRSATKPDNCGSTRPIWNERLTLPLDASSIILTLDIFHSKPSETPKPLVGTAKVPLVQLVDLDHLSISPTITTLDLRLPSGRPQGKVRIKTALHERPLPPPPQPEQNYQMLHPSGYYYYSFAPPPPLAHHHHHHPDYQTPSPPPPPHYPSHHVPLPHPPSPSLFSPYSRAYSDSYSGYYSVSGDAGGDGFYLTAPQARPMYYERPTNYDAPSAPVGYSPAAYEHHQHHQKVEGSRMGRGAGLAVGAVAGTLGALALEERTRYKEEKNIADRVERDFVRRDDYSGYHGDY